jgi:hypothetical protein
MKTQPKGPQAARIRQSKFEWMRQFQIPDDLLPGSLSMQHLRCGTSDCHCAKNEGHAVWSLPFMVDCKSTSSTPRSIWSCKSRSKWRQGGSIRMPSVRFWGPTPDCWSWHASSGRFEATRSATILRYATRFSDWRSYLRSPGTGGFVLKFLLPRFCARWR